VIVDREFKTANARGAVRVGFGRKTMGFHFGLYDALGLVLGVAILVGICVVLRKLLFKR
jgi:hypothetical protein